MDRPRLLASRTQSSMMATDGAVSITPHAEGAMLSWNWEYHLQGRARFLTPVFAPFAGRWERRNWTRLREFLERPADR